MNANTDTKIQNIVKYPMISNSSLSTPTENPVRLSVIDTSAH